MGNLSDFHRVQIVGARLVGASLTKTVTLLGASRAAVSEVMKAYTNHGETSSVKRNSGRKPKLSEMNRRTLKRTVSKNHRTAAAKVTAEFSIHLKTLLKKRTRTSQIQHPRYRCNCE
jgi:predicted transcriptional regulator